jgi:hypothetical protein
MNQVPSTAGVEKRDALTDTAEPVKADVVVLATGWRAPARADHPALPVRDVTLARTASATSTSGARRG